VRITVPEKPFLGPGAEVENLLSPSLCPCRKNRLFRVKTPE
jgi:hypothetical protein